MKRAVFLLLFLATPPSVYAVDAAECTQSAVQTAVTNTSRNGAMNVPGGSFATCGTWTGITISKGLTIIGVDDNDGTLTSSPGAVRAFKAAPAASSTPRHPPVIVEGFRQQGSRAAFHVRTHHGPGVFPGPYRKAVWK